MEKQLEPALRAAVTFLEEHGYRYAIIGGVALPHWNVIRATYDVDVKVVIPDLDYAAARAVLRAAFPTPAREHAPHNPLIVAVTIEGVIVDFLFALPGYEEQIIERAVQRDMGGWTAWVCSAEDLIIQKAIAGRDKDWLDIEALLIEQHHQLDRAYVQHWLTQFADVLEDPEILTHYQQILSGLPLP